MNNLPATYDVDVTLTTNAYTLIEEAERAKQIINANNVYSMQEIYLFSEKYEKEIKGTDISTISQDEKQRLQKNIEANRNLMYAVFVRKYSRHSSEHIGKRVLLGNDCVCFLTVERNLIPDGFSLKMRKVEY